MNQQTYNPNMVPNQQQGTTPNPNLPPAGYQRDEVLKQRTDNLQQQGEIKANQEQRFAIDPNKMAPIREIRHSMSALDVTDKVKGYEYCWVNFKTPNDTPGLCIQQKQASQVYNYETKSWEAVWQIVHGNMPECASRKGVGADTTRRLGDVMLMRAKKSAYDALKEHQAGQGKRLIQADEATLMDMGEKANSKSGGGITIHPQGHPAFMSSRGTSQGVVNQAPSQDELNWQLKSGRLPGAGMENFAGKR